MAFVQKRVKIANVIIKIFKFKKSQKFVREGWQIKIVSRGIVSRVHRQ